MNRAGFFKAIGGAVAATVGIKHVPECLSYTANYPPCRPMVLADVIKVKKIVDNQSISPALTKAIKLETERINVVARRFIEDSDRMLIEQIKDEAKL